MPHSFQGNQFLIGSEFDSDLEHEIIIPLTVEIKRQARRLDKNKDGVIDIYINSFGGYGHLANHLIELVELAKRNGIIVRTIVTDSAFSAGSMLAIAGTPGERYIARTAFHLVHYGSITSFEATPLQAERYGKWKNAFFSNNVKHYKKYADIPNLEEQIKDDGFFVTAAESIKWKMADKYIDKLELLV